MDGAFRQLCAAAHTGAIGVELLVYGGVALPECWRSFLKDASKDANTGGISEADCITPAGVRLTLPHTLGQLLPACFRAARRS